MHTTDHTPTDRRPGRALSTRNKVGLGIAGVICVLNIPSVFTPTPDGEVGPPFVVLVAGTVVGLVGLVAVVIGWRSGSKAALRVVAACLVVSVVTALPALFVDVPAVIKILVATLTLVTFASLVLMFSDDRQPAPVLD